MYQMRLSSEELRSAPRPASFLPASTRRRFVKLGRKTSDGSQQSVSSTGSSSTSRSAEGSAIRQPSRSRLHRQANRLSGVFRGPGSGSMALTSLRSSLSIQSRKASMISADALVAEDPSELSNQITAPGILKIFGNEICEGAHYKSVLATTHSSAKELVKEALERYGLNKEEAESYVLCDAIGSVAGHRWTTEGFRVVGDHEKPLLLQSLWKPREGLARRFEIQRRRSVEERASKDKDTVTAGINAQARKLQKSRSRVTSTLIERTMGRGHRLWRSRSEMDLLDSDSDTKQEPGHQRCIKNRSESLIPTSLQSYERSKTSPEQNHIHGLAAPHRGDGGSRAKTETLCPSGPKDEGEGEESEREETESSDDNTTQYSIHPPHDCPYLLLLQGCSPPQDFVIYLLVMPTVVIGRPGRHGDESKPDIFLFADDILPIHCCLHRRGAGSPTTLCPSEGATVTRNGETVRAEAGLSPGDVIGLGRHYLFLFKDPVAPAHKEVNCAAPGPRTPGHIASTTSCTRAMSLCGTSSSTCPDSQAPSSRAPPCLKTPEGHGLTLNYGTEDERRIVEEYSSTHLHTSDLRRLLLLIAGGVQGAMWEKTKDLAAAQPDVPDGDGSNPEDLQPLSLQEVIAGLRPLVAWMSNSLELLHFIQHQLPLVLEWRTRKEREHEKEERRDDESEGMKNLAMLELHLSCVRSASEETTAVLEEVLMLAFQQCVYYITKVLYPILLGLLDCNPFRESPGPQAAGAPGTAGLQVPAEIRQIVEVLADAWRLLSERQLHPEISSQLLGYVFYFINASLFNSLMERGSEPGFYQWSSGVRMRANLDLLLDWAHAAGLGELALEHTYKLSSAINLLATPRKNLLQTSWGSLRSDYPALNPAQLNHLLSLYSPSSPLRLTWTPSVHDRAAAQRTAYILENFDTHHPLVLPEGGYQFQLTRPVTVSGVREELDKLRGFISSLSASHSGDVPAAGRSQIQGGTRTDTLDPSPPGMQTLQTDPPPPTPSDPSPPSPPSPLSSPHLDEFSSCGALLLSQKLRNLEQTRDMRRSALDPSCLLTPPNTPHAADPEDVGKMEQDYQTQAGGETPPRCDEGSLVFECLAALTSSCPSMKRIVELKEDEEEEEEEKEEEEEEEKEEEEEEEQEEEEGDNSHEEVFSLELERGERGLGLALVDTKDTSWTVKGIFIRAVLPDSPAARCQKLEPGDRILAVNGVSLLGLDYHSGRELIQSSGDRLKLLVARCDWMAKAVQAES